MSFPQSRKNESHLNINAVKSTPIKFTFFDPTQIDPMKHYAALEVLQDHLKYIYDRVVRITDFHPDKYLINLDQSEMLKSIYKVMDDIVESQKNEKESRKIQIEKINQKNEKIKAKIIKYQHEILSPSSMMSLQTKSIIDDMTKPKLDYIYETLAKGKDKIIIPIIESIVSLILNNENPQPQEVEETIRDFGKFKEKINFFNITNVNQKIIDNAFQNTSHAMEEIQKLESNKLFPPKKVYSNLLPFGKWILSIILDSKNILSKDEQINKFEKFKNKQKICEDIIGMNINSDNNINLVDQISKVNEIIRKRMETASNLNNLVEKFNFDNTNLWENLMKDESESIKSLYMKKETKVRKTIEEENMMKTQFEQSSVVPSYFCGFCSWFRRSKQ